MLILAPIMRALDWSQSFELLYDASGYAIKAVFGQRKDKKSVANASKVLDSAQVS
jgi:hypothetical protein